MSSRLRAEMTASDPPQHVVRVRGGLPPQVQAVVAATAHAVLPEQPGVLFAIVGRVDHLRDLAGPDVESWIMRPASADLASGMDHQLELRFRARHVALHDIGEVPGYVVEVAIPREPARVRPLQVLKAAQRGFDLVGTDPILYGHFPGTEQKCLIGSEIQVKPDLKLLRQPCDIGQVMDIVPHDGEVHADLQPKTLTLADQVPEVADRRIKSAGPAADMIVDALVWAVHRYVEALDPGGEHLFKSGRGEADSIRVQVHMPDASGMRVGHDL